MTGAPKLRSMRLLRELEARRRGVYSGTLGYISLNGCLDFNVIIRSIVCTPEQCSIGAGHSSLFHNYLSVQPKFDDEMIWLALRNNYSSLHFLLDFSS